MFELKLRWTTATGETLDPVLFALLRGVDDLGSLRRAATEAGVSYRHAWGLMEKWHQLLELPLVLLERGRGARLMPAGRMLLQIHQQSEQELADWLRQRGSELDQSLEALRSESSSGRLRIHASHGLAVMALRELLEQQPRIEFEFEYHGSHDAVGSLLDGNADVAGFHVPEGSELAGFTRDFMKRLDPKRYICSGFVIREQGLMTAPGNPMGLAELADLEGNKVRFLNRQKGSGTRLLLDQLLQMAGVATNAIRGYDNEEFTHTAVAAMIASGEADAGFGIASAAHRFHLEFIPLQRERYYFAFARERLEDPVIQSFLQTMHGSHMRRHIRRTRGYELLQADVPEGAVSNLRQSG